MKVQLNRLSQKLEEQMPKEIELIRQFFFKNKEELSKCSKDV